MVQRRCATVISRERVCPGIDQALHLRREPGEVQWGPAVHRSGVGSCSRLEKEANALGAFRLV